MRALIFIACLCATRGLASTEPARGSPDRAALRDAIGPHAELQLGPPVEFVAERLRDQGNLGFAMVQLQHPGGKQIDPMTLPMVRHDPSVIGFLHGLHVKVLYQKSGKTRVAVHRSIKAADVSWPDTALCAIYASLISDA